MPDQTIPATPPSSEPQSEAVPTRKYVENKPPRGLYVRVFIYVIATHVLLAMMSLVVIAANSR
ncbi:DUF6126 family protein [Streptomyces sp. Je 1-4]|uniref:DUF6126 family protein n=1 Tax=Streptomyces TaxID=1883 RepID=UPI0021D950E1|nr:MULTISPECIES: DUF6126 family protein [unclassified Streptomyces]UYB39161.1 DUF6126 family protein [Streptomyces sp. Je 1-4]UZQ35172.1 DUF6126 family protein [Streptomyces sp. Je 1-4] [Streptomyces sp. Je 1-4 4N24]UZQ42590.1 DUF6126 family protein [Streptomyces sp. Je 1-4] [Streptomyces sp. Je 1-4 4N24_ara]